MKKCNVILTGMVALLMLLLSACAATNLAYNNAPTIANYYIDDWLDLSSDQSAWLKPRVAKFMAWHRLNEVPVYRELLSEAKERLDNTKNAEEDIARFYTKSRLAIDRLTQEAMPDMVSLIQTIDAKQIVYLDKKFTTENEKIAKEMRLSADARRLKRVERNTDRFNSWMGKLSDAQIMLIKKHAANVPESEALRLADRRRWQREFITFLKSKPDIFAIEAELRSLLLAPEKRRAKEYQAAWQRQQDDMMKLTADIITTANAKQKEAIKKKLTGYDLELSKLKIS